MKGDDMNLIEYLINAGQLERLMKQLETYGDSQAELEYLCNMPVCCESKKIELRVDSRYFLWIERKGWFSEGEIILLQTERIKYCCFSKGECTSDEVILRYDNGSEKVIIVLRKSGGSPNMKIVFNNIRKFVHGFENLSSTYQEHRIKLGVRHEDIIGPDGWFLEVKKTFSEKIIRCNLISSLQDICWCEQIHAYDSDTGYDYYLDVYFTNGEKKRVSAASVYDAFRLALAVKDNVPHLLYEPCEEYKRIYQENPRQFLEIVKQRG